MNSLRDPPEIEGILSESDVVFAAWNRYLRSEYSRETAKAYDKALLRFSAWLNGEGFEELSLTRLIKITSAEVREWREHLLNSYSASTVNLWLTGLRRFYAWLNKHGAPIQNPAEKVKGANLQGQSKHHKRDELTASEVRAVLNTCRDTDLGKRDRAILSLMAYCALRTVEAQRADIEDLRTKDDRTILRIIAKGQPKAEDFVVLPSPAESAMSDWLEVRGDDPGPLFWSMSRQNHGERLSRRAIRGLVKQRFREAGVVSKGKTAHSLRHSAITSAIRNGATPRQVQRMARHRSFDATLSYYQEVGRTADPAEDLIAYGQ